MNLENAINLAQLQLLLVVKLVNVDVFKFPAIQHKQAEPHHLES